VTRAPRAVADVNVLVSAVRTPHGLCGRLLEAAIDGRWQPVVSMMLFEGLGDVLARPKLRDVLGQETADRFLAGLLAVAEWAPDPEGAPAISTRDPDDDYHSRSRAQQRPTCSSPGTATSPTSPTRTRRSRLPPSSRGASAEQNGGYTRISTRCLERVRPPSLPYLTSPFRGFRVLPALEEHYAEGAWLDGITRRSSSQTPSQARHRSWRSAF
jgi:hypothetical protein